MARTLATGCRRLDTLPRYWTIAQLAEHFEVPERWVRDRAEDGILGPVALTRGLHQYSRGALLRLAAYRVLTETCGRASKVPAAVIREVGDEIDRLCNIDGVWSSEVHDAVSAGILDVALGRAAAESLLESIDT
jgi:hypothetical protein